MTRSGTRKDRVFSLWLKIPYTLFVALLVPVYAVQHGPENFLWFSDVALLGMTVALWRESRLLTSMMSVGFLLPELLWLLDFTLTALLGRPVLQVADYMFGGEMELYLRVLSGFHLFLPLVMLFALHRLGYEPRALRLQIPLTMGIILATWLLTGPERNINWVFGPGEAQALIPPVAYLALMMLAFPVVTHLPAHFLLRKLFPWPRTRP
jgi:hypothetical protein